MVCILSQPLLHPGKKLYPLRKRKKTVEKDHRINSGKMAEKNKTLFHQIKEVSALLGEKERLAQQNKTNTFFGCFLRYQ